MWELDHKEAEHQRSDAFSLWCWRRLLRVPWTARRSKQSILKGISPEYLLEGLMLKLKLQYCGHLMQRTDSLEKTLMLGKIEDRGEGDDRGWDGWMDMNLSQLWSWWWTGKPGVLQSMGSQRVGHDQATELNELTERMTETQRKSRNKSDIWRECIDSINETSRAKWI